MEFWGEEVKPGAKVSCKAEEGYLIHLSQAALGETKTGSESVVVYVQVDDKKLVLGTLSVDKYPQIMCDLIFEDDFEISHSSKTTSVFLCGYKSPDPSFESHEEMETEGIPIKNKKYEIKKSGADVPVKDDKNAKQDEEETSSGDDDFTDDSDDSEMSEDSDEETSSGADLTGNSEDETDDSEEQSPTPKPEAVGKKRATEAVTPSGKKAKVEPSGQKTGDKKGAHVSTPHPAKQAGKTPAADKKSKEKSPKSGSHACKSCNKTFGSEKAMEAHKKAKHEA